MEGYLIFVEILRDLIYLYWIRTGIPRSTFPSLQMLNQIISIWNQNNCNYFPTYLIIKKLFSFVLFNWLEIHNSGDFPFESHYFCRLINGHNNKFSFISLEKKWVSYQLCKKLIVLCFTFPVHVVQNYLLVKETILVPKEKLSACFQ